MLGALRAKGLFAIRAAGHLHRRCEASARKTLNLGIAFLFPWPKGLGHHYTTPDGLLGCLPNENHRPLTSMPSSTNIAASTPESKKSKRDGDC